MAIAEQAKPTFFCLLAARKVPFRASTAPGVSHESAHSIFCTLRCSGRDARVSAVLSKRMPYAQVYLPSVPCDP